MRSLKCLNAKNTKYWKRKNFQTNFSYYYSKQRKEKKLNFCNTCYNSYRYYAEISEFIGQKEKEAEKTDDTKGSNPKKKKENDGKLIKKETSAEGRVDVKHYTYYLKEYFAII